MFQSFLGTNSGVETWIFVRIVDVDDAIGEMIVKGFLRRQNVL